MVSPVDHCHAVPQKAESITESPEQKVVMGALTPDMQPKGYGIVSNLVDASFT